MFNWLVELVKDTMAFLFSVSGNYGVAIILLSVAVRIVILPLTISQNRAIKRMQVVAPEMNKLKEKYKGQPEKLNKETMELYRTYKVNPFSSCLPMLIQLPFLWAVFRGLQTFPYQGTPSFIWIANLAQPDTLYVLPVLTAITTYWMSATTSLSNDPSQRMMLYVFPVLLGWMSLSFPAGLALYWVVGNVLTVAQQYLVPVGTAAKGDATP